MTINFYKLDVVPLSINLHASLILTSPTQGILSATDQFRKEWITNIRNWYREFVVRLDRRLAASLFGTYPSNSAADWTRSLVSFLTEMSVCWFSTRETVALDKPDSLAAWIIVGQLPIIFNNPLLKRSHCFINMSRSYEINGKDLGRRAQISYAMDWY